MTPDFSSPKVAAAFETFAPAPRAGLLRLRELIFEVADEIAEVGRVEEALRWGQPAYLTPESKSGSTLRLGAPKSGGFALYAHCQTNIISAFAEAFAGMDKIEGNRAVHFGDLNDIDPVRHAQLIRHALTYHVR